MVRARVSAGVRDRDGLGGGSKVLRCAVGWGCGQGGGSKCRAPEEVLEADREDVRVVLVVEHFLWVRDRGGVGAW